MKRYTGLYFWITLYTSMALLISEIALTRIFSVILNSHYVFVVISFALLGLGLGRLVNGIWFTRYADPHRYRRVLFILGAISFPLSSILLVWLPVTTGVNFGDPGFYLYLLIATVPFIFGGMNLSWIFQQWAGRASLLYAGDLLGAAIGGVASWLFLDTVGALGAAIGAGLVAATGTLIFAFLEEKVRFSYAIPLALTAVLFFGIFWNWYPRVPIGSDEDKDLYRLVQSGIQPKILESRWSAFGRTDLIEIPGDQHRRLLFVDGAAGTPMIHIDSTMDKRARMEMMHQWSLQFFPFTFLAPHEKDSAYIIGPGGGKDILIAKSTGVKQITAVEVNPEMVDLVRKYRDYNDGIYTDWDNVDVHIGEGRQFLRSNPARYDIISLALPVTKSRRSYEGYALTEDYLFTKEALAEYLSHLTPEGRIMILAHGDAEVIRLVSTVLQTLEEQGVSNREAMKRLYTISDGMMALLVIKKQPFSREEAQKRVRLMHKFHLHKPIAYFPYAQQHRMSATLSNGKRLPVPMYPQAFIDVESGLFKANVAFTDFSLNVSPVTDNKPFFYDFSFRLPRTLVVLAFVFGTLLLSVLIVLMRKNSHLSAMPSSIQAGKSFLAFSLLGIGFMMTEVTLFQKSVLYFRHPTLALTVLLTVILLGTGIGSWISHLWKTENILRRIQRAGWAVATLLFLFWATNSLLQSWSTSAAQPLLVLYLFLAGIALGVPFPMMLRYLHAQSREDLVPFAWGINGIASVTGSVFSVIFAKWFGWSFVLIIAAIVYIGMTLIVFRIEKTEREQLEVAVDDMFSFREEEVPARQAI